MKIEEVKAYCIVFLLIDDILLLFPHHRNLQEESEELFIEIC